MAAFSDAVAFKPYLGAKEKYREDLLLNAERDDQKGNRRHGAEDQC